MALVELRADRGVSEKTEFAVQKNSKTYSNLGFSPVIRLGVADDRRQPY